MPGIVPFDCVGAFSIDASNVATSPIVRGGTVADTGVGSFDIALSDGGIDATQCIIQATLREATEGTVKVQQFSDVVIQVTTFDVADAAADLDSDVIIFRII